MSWFERNTPVMDAIDKATSDGHASEDIAFHLEICDMVNQSEQAAKDAIKALKKKLTQKTNVVSLIKALVVLETLMKNCQRSVHLQISDTSFCDVLFKLICGRNAVGGLAREKALAMIQSWNDAFRHDLELGGLRELYVKLLGEGVEFPPQDHFASLDTFASIMTPQAAAVAHPVASNSVTSGSSRQSDEEIARALDRQFREEDERARRERQQQEEQSQRQVQALNGAPQQPTSTGFPRRAIQTIPEGRPRRSRFEYRPQHIPPGERVEATSEQVTKIRADLAIVQQNTTLLHDLLRNLGPDERVKDNELINDIAQTCEQMQKRVTKLCEQITNEDLIGALLTMNDRLNDAQRMFHLRSSQEEVLSRAEASSHAAIPSNEELPVYTPSYGPGHSFNAPLVSFNDSAQTTTDNGNSAAHRPNDSLSGEDESDLSPPPFDMFSQTRNMSMSDQFNTGPGYVTANDSVFINGRDPVSGGDFFKKESDLQDREISEGAMMTTSSLLKPKNSDSLLIDLGDNSASSSGYMEVAPPKAPPTDLLGTLDLLGGDSTGQSGYLVVEPPQDQLIDVSAPPAPAVAREPQIYGDGQIRQLSERERNKLESTEDSIFGL